jgi:hypothetical protein
MNTAVMNNKTSGWRDTNTDALAIEVFFIAVNQQKKWQNKKNPEIRQNNESLFVSPLKPL